MARQARQGAIRPGPCVSHRSRARRASWSLHRALALERARADRLEAALAEARRPWLVRLLEAVRRR
jgi:hypothetical protein